MAEFPVEWAELPGDVEMTRAHDIFGDQTTFRVEHRCGTYRYAGMKSVSDRFIVDTADPRGLEQWVLQDLDRWIRPWAYPDRMRWPHWEPFPHLSRFVDRLVSICRPHHDRIAAPIPQE